jgi:hypothetical protein
MTSPFSATNIGLNTKSNKHDAAKEYFKREANDIQNYLKGVHHTRKDTYMQVQYASTVDKLGKCLQEKSEYSRISADKPKSTRDNLPSNYQEFMTSMSKNISSEFSLNDRRRRYNKEMGRQAVVNDIISGKAKESKVYLFPHKATHTQILAMTGKLAMPSVDAPPPEVPRERRWLGDAIGFEN